MYKIIILTTLIWLFAGCQNKKNTINSEVPQISIKLYQFNKDSVKVEYSLTKLHRDTLFFKIPYVIPGSYAIYNSDKYISDIVCYDINNNKLTVIKEEKNSFLIIGANNIKNLNYYVKFGNSEKMYDALTKIVLTDSFCMINPISCLGYFDGFKNAEHKIEISRPNNLYTIFKTNKTTLNSKIDIFNYNNYHELVESPLLYSKLDTSSLENNINASISVYSDNKNINADLIKKWINPITHHLNKNTSFIRDNKSLYRFMFIFSNNFLSESALEQKNASAYCLRANWDTTFLRKMVQHLVAHEFYHTITPLSFHSNIYDTQLYQNFTSKHLWLYEGFIEYLSLKTMLISNQINHNEFLKFISQMKYSNNQNVNCEEQSLIYISSNILTKECSDGFDKFYSKGALLAFCLDLSLSNNSQGYNSLFLSLQQYIEKNGKVFDEEQFVGNFLSFSKIKNINIIETDKDLYRTVDSLLLSIGYVFSNNKIFWSEHFEHSFNIDSSYSIKDKHFIQFGNDSPLKNKTVELLTINNKKVTSKIINIKLIYPVNSSEIAIDYIYNNIKNSKSIKPVSGMNAIFIKNIYPVQEQTEIMKHNNNYFFVNR